ncbi:hypothetical protein BJ741DRAFT_667154 [Chytriomyces cf. hyalinus JEL632]|nr:hypothetical protein BJ741DRAFT_667154 [Chytriomyces cf. hyalinus JEL632]
MTCNADTTGVRRRNPQTQPLTAAEEPRKQNHAASNDTQQPIKEHGNELVDSFSIGRIVMPIALILFMACAALMVVFALFLWIMAHVQKDLLQFLRQFAGPSGDKPALNIVRREIRQRG